MFLRDTSTTAACLTLTSCIAALSWAFLLAEPGATASLCFAVAHAALAWSSSSWHRCMASCGLLQDSVVPMAMEGREVV